MRVFLISSSEDPASITIKHQLLNNTEFKEQETFLDTPILSFPELNDVYLITIPDRTIYHDDLDIEINKKLGVKADLIIFLSRHSSKMKTPTLTTHPIGNYGSAEFGGKAQTLVPAEPRLMTHLLRMIYKKHSASSLGYQVCFEVTHHGPFLSTPTIYVEVGSTEIEWKQSKPAKIIASSVYETLKEFRNETNISNDMPVLIGIGGGHYAPRFTDIILERDAAFGHMIPSYHIDAGNITKRSLEITIAQTPHISAAYIHKKGLKKPQVRMIKDLLKEVDIPVISSKELPLLP
jgi:D-aminoacyl-tRNA deacylase